MCHPYSRRVQYYETDQMAVVHHSNYIRWFEEARMDYMRQAGLSCSALEARGLIIPVVEVGCKYRTSATLEALFSVETRLTHCDSVRFRFSYTVTLPESGAVCVTGFSEHCYLDANHRPISIKRKFPDVLTQLQALVETE